MAIKLTCFLTTKFFTPSIANEEACDINLENILQSKTPLIIISLSISITYYHKSDINTKAGPFVTKLTR